jgi:hypothetical protein
MANFLYRWAVIFKERLLDPVLLTDRRRMPDPVISFEKMRIDTLAAYTLVRNPQGLLDEITFNTVHLDRSRWETLETLLHEQCHLWQQNFGEDPVRPGRTYHNREFCDKCESLGLHPRLGTGAHYRPADGVFGVLMKEHGMKAPQPIEAPELYKKNWWELLDDLLGKEKKKGVSTLNKWSCPCGENVRVGSKKWPGATCARCGGEYRQASIDQTLYQSKKEEDGN